MLPVLLMGAIAWNSHRPMPLALRHGLDKVVHALVFGILALLWLLALAPRQPGARAAFGPALLALSITSVWGILDEIHQSYVPGRTPSTADAAADFAGAAIAAAAFVRSRARSRAT
ncbi:MAG: VanZ family protein [Acidobacteria bacterium]|nr:VanZ family protein [Acidobacteriota bacterium]